MAAIIFIKATGRLTNIEGDKSRDESHSELPEVCSRRFGGGKGSKHDTGIERSSSYNRERHKDCFHQIPPPAPPPFLPIIHLMPLIADVTVAKTVSTQESPTELRK